jgi:hypothetical protein
VLTFAVGLGEGAVVPISIASLFIIGILLTASPVVYQTVEKVEWVKVGGTILFLAVVVTFVISLRTWGEVPGQVVGNFGRIPEGLSIALVTFVYSVMLIKLNRSALPDAIKVRGFRLGGPIAATAFYGFFSILLLISQANTLLGGG